jgi:hypothetical protein
MKQQQRRHRLILGLLALGLLAGVALTAGPAQAVDAVGPYYAEPSWDQKKAAANRFVVLTNWNSAAVLDKETGLVWEKAPTGTGPWLQALGQCIVKNVGGRKGWRLPSIQELASLVDATQVSPALPLGHPFTVLSAVYWSATTIAEDPTLAWVVNVGNGDVFPHGKSTVSYPVWCVRGGMSVEPH